MPEAPAWSILVVRSASPGAVFRLLQRRAATLTVLPDAFLLSEPTLPQGWRLLVAEPPSSAALSEFAPALSTAFGPSVIMLFRDGDRWGSVTWQKGEKTGEETNTLPTVAPMERFLSRLPGMKSSDAPYLVWAKAQGLPVNRIAAITNGEKTAPVAYRTVSSLDERNLLIENAPRLYRFPLKEQL